jgi:hypothetical protein
MAAFSAIIRRKKCGACQNREGLIRLTAPLLFLAAWAACADPVAGPEPITDSTYVEVMFELLNARNTPGADSIALASERSETLRRHNVTLEDLEKKSEILARTPARAAEVWTRLRLKFNPQMGKRGTDQ